MAEEAKKPNLDPEQRALVAQHIRETLAPIEAVLPDFERLAEDGNPVTQNLLDLHRKRVRDIRESYADILAEDDETHSAD